MFKNRQDAARQLAGKLNKYQNKEGVVLAIPRGGVPVGFEIALHLHWPLDIVLSKKIGHPTNKEYAIGAVSSTGRIINQGVPVSSDYIEEETARIRSALQNNYHKYRGGRTPEPVTDKTLILTDDGVATGHTMLSTIDLVKRDKPARIIVAIPVAAPEALRKIEERVDEVICLAAPEIFRSVGQFYETFKQTSDEEVIDNLQGRRYHDA